MHKKNNENKTESTFAHNHRKSVLGKVSTFLGLFFLSAHDNDVKEANKQKCQQPGQQQQGQTMYHTSSQATTVPQHLHHPTIQYSQQAQQPGLPPNQRSASYLSNLQAPTGSQLSSSQITTSLEPKSNITNRAYQVNMHYTCTAPCFDR